MLSSRGMDAIDGWVWLTRVFQSSYLKFSVMMTLGFLVQQLTRLS